jgi:leucyl-tRNA synthetase
MGTTMLPEYDFSNKRGVRGKYHQAYVQGQQVNIHKDDGSVEIHYFGKSDENVQKFTTDKTVRKVIVVPKKLVNIVVG